MFCPNCGTQLPDGSRFCSACGASTGTEMPEIEEPVVQPAEERPAEPVQQAAPAEPVREAAPAEPVREAPAQPVPPQPRKPVRKPAHKKLNPKFLILVAAAVLVVVLVIVGISMLAGGSSDPTCIYLSDNEYYLLTDAAKGESAMIEKARSDDYGSYNLVQFSPDGKYVYFFTKFDGDNYCGTLNRVPVSKLGKNEDKNSKHVETIDSKVDTGLAFVTDSNFIYTSGGSLYYFDGKDSVRIDRKYDYYQASYPYLAYTTVNKKGHRDLYLVDLRHPDEAVELSNKPDGLEHLDEKGNAICVKYHENDSAVDLIRYSPDGEEELLSDMADILGGRDGFYYLGENGNEYDLLDLVGGHLTNSALEDMEDLFSKKDRKVKAQSLYFYSCKGEITEVVSDVYQSDSTDGGQAILTIEGLRTMPVADPLETVDALYRVMPAACDLVLAYDNGKLLTIPDENRSELLELQQEQELDYDPTFTILTDGIYVSMPTDDDTPVVYYAKAKGGSLQAYEELDDDLSKPYAGFDGVYTFGDVYETDYATYGDLYVLEGAEAKRLVRDVQVDHVIRVYDDGKILAYTDGDYYDGFELTLFNKKGEGERIADETIAVYRLDKNKILYLTADGELCYYDGKHDEEVADDVSDVWVSKGMEYDYVTMY